MFSKDFFKIFIGKETSDDALFCKNRFFKGGVYYYDEKELQFINIQDVNDIIQEKVIVIKQEKAPQGSISPILSNNTMHKPIVDEMTMGKSTTSGMLFFKTRY